MARWPLLLLLLILLLLLLLLLLMLLLLCMVACDNWRNKAGTVSDEGAGGNGGGCVLGVVVVAVSAGMETLW